MISCGGTCCGHFRTVGGSCGAKWRGGYSVQKVLDLADVAGGREVGSHWRGGCYGLLLISKEEKGRSTAKIHLDSCNTIEVCRGLFGCENLLYSTGMISSEFYSTPFFQISHPPLQSLKSHYTNHFLALWLFFNKFKYLSLKEHSRCTDVSCLYCPN